MCSNNTKAQFLNLKQYKLTYIRDRQGEVEFLIEQAKIEAERKGEIKGEIKGRAQGEIEGEIKGEIKLILRLLERRFGNSEEIRPLLQELSLEQLEDLGVAILDFTTLEEVVNFISTLS